VAIESFKAWRTLSSANLIFIMKLGFPNPCRSYDPEGHGVRFWAHDGALEIPFFVEAEALSRISPKADHDEPGFLGAFDLNREQIHKVAAKVYARYAKASYTLAASNF
jgi:hypothetical protein